MCLLSAAEKVLPFQIDNRSFKTRWRLDARVNVPLPGLKLKASVYAGAQDADAAHR